MAASPYLGNYGIFKETDYFKISFDIPINCNYAITHNPANNTYTIAVELNPAEKHPSTTFNTENENLECNVDGFVEVDFELPSTSGLGLAKKPKLTVNDLIP